MAITNSGVSGITAGITVADCWHVTSSFTNPNQNGGFIAADWSRATYGQLGNIGAAIQSHAENNHYSVVEDYCGHGIGQIYHDEPQILHFGKRDSGLEIKPGLCFTIEPMIYQGDKRTKVLNDGWTVVTKDGRNSAQWEHTVAVTENGYDILTKRSEEALD